MASKRQLSDQDPDYESIPFHIQQKKLRLLEQDVKEATVRKIERIIRSQFMQEIANKESEVDQISEQLSQARTLLDRLRASIVMKYYATGGQTVTESSTETHPSSSIHPSIKKYLGKAPVSTSLPQNLPNKSHTHDSTTKPITTHDSLQSSNITDTTLLTQNGDHLQDKNSDAHSRAARLKKKCRIVVGNVSKYIPAGRREDNDQATHKWMVYVRGSKERPKIDDVVKKVIFFLHPSYRPNDLVEIGNPPFHLTRRGWGEFPVRVQLHFHDQRNKPVDIIHNLKLDKTLTGLQTLGAETLVDVWLFKPEDKYKNIHGSLKIQRLSTVSYNQTVQNTHNHTEAESAQINISDLDASIPSKEKLKSIPYFDIPDLLPNGNVTSGDTVLFEHPANDIEEEVVVSSESGPSFTPLVNIKQEPVEETTSKVMATLDFPTKSTVVHKSTEKISAGVVSASLTSTQTLLNPIASTSSANQTLSSIHLPSTENPQKGAVIVLNVSSKPNQEARLVSTPTISKISSGTTVDNSSKLTLSPQLPITSIVSSMITSTSGSSIQNTSICNDTGEGINQTNVSSMLHNAKNGLKTFVKCIGDKGQLILVPYDSLLKSQSSTSSSLTKVLNTPVTAIANQSKPQKSLIKNVSSTVTSTTPAVPMSTLINGAQVPPVSSPAKLMTSPPSYFVRMLPNPTGGPGKLIFIPNVSSTSTATLPKTTVDTTFPQIKCEASNQESVMGQFTKRTNLPNSQVIISKEVKFLPKFSNKLHEDPSLHGANIKSLRREDALGELQRAIDSIRLSHYETFPLLVKKVVKLHPLVASNPDRSCHPYCAPSTESFYSWNIGKRKAAEWSRAVAVKETLLQILRKNNDEKKWSEKDVWSTKRIMVWCKRHGFTPLKNDCLSTIVASESAFKSMPTLTTKTDPKDLIEAVEKQHSVLQSQKCSQQEDEEIDIISVEEEKPVLKTKLKESPEKSNKESMIYLPFFSKAAQFVKEKAQDIGVNIKPLEIIPSVSAPVVEEVILSACKEFIGDILRSALNEGFERLGGKRCPEVIEASDVIKGILKLPFCDQLTNEALGVPITQETSRSHLQAL